MRRSQELQKNFKDKNVLELSKVSAFNHTRRKNKVHQIRDDLILTYLTHIIQKDLTKNASGQITDHYDLPQNPSVLSWR